MAWIVGLGLREASSSRHYPPVVRGGHETDEARERALGRVPVWLPLEDVRLLAKHCFCEDRGNEEFARHSWRCRYLRMRVDAALDKAGDKAATAAVARRVTFFVGEADRTSDGWLVRGEPGLGPPQTGDRFTFVQHQDDTGEEAIDVQVAEVGEAFLRLVGSTEVALRASDILGGERRG